MRQITRAGREKNRTWMGTEYAVASVCVSHTEDQPRKNCKIMAAKTGRNERGPLANFVALVTTPARSR
jgi:hypothetical protein